MAHTGSMPTAQPTLDEARAQLDRVLSSEVFAAAKRLQRFLRYVVERSLAGEGDQLKEYAIGVAVYDRGEQYDPRIDSIVRVEAGRLRTKIDEYYSGAGARDPVRIRIPRGGYVPVFERRLSDVAAPVAPVDTPRSPRRRVASWRLAQTALVVVILLIVITAWRTTVGERSEGRAPPVTVAVLPFASYSTDAADQMLAARVTDGVTSELVRIGTVGVVSRTSAFNSPAFAGPSRTLRGH